MRRIQQSLLVVLLLAAAAAAQTGSTQLDLSRNARGLVVVPGAVLENPKIADSGLVQWKWPTAVAPQRFSCSVLGAPGESVTIQIELRTESDPDSAGAQVLSSSLVCPSGASGVAASFAVSVFPQNAPVALVITAVSGSPKALRVYPQTKSQ